MGFVVSLFVCFVFKLISFSNELSDEARSGINIISNTAEQKGSLMAE